MALGSLAWDVAPFGFNSPVVLLGMRPVLVAEARECGFHSRRSERQGLRPTGLRGAMRACGVTLHVARHTRGRSSTIGGRTTRHCGFGLSQRLRKRAEETFGWMRRQWAGSRGRATEAWIERAVLATLWGNPTGLARMPD